LLSQRISKLLITPVGLSCNLRCDYCYNAVVRGPSRKLNLMSLDLLAKLYHDFLAVAAHRVVIIWHGGEPTLAGLEFFEQAVNLQSVLCESGITVENCIQTNATLLTPKWCQFFA